MEYVTKAFGKLRRIITATDSEGQSEIMIDDGPAATFLSGDVAGLFEIWTDQSHGPLETSKTTDQAQGKPVLSPAPGKVKIRWFSIAPNDGTIPDETIREMTRAAFVEMGAGDHQPDTRKHPAMHVTDTLDAIILIKGQVKLILDKEETIIGPGDVVVQRATNHAWAVVSDEPALFVAVLMDRTG